MSKSNKIIHGSWKNKIVSSDLLEERATKDWEGSLEDILDHKITKRLNSVMNFMHSDPGLMNSHKFYDMTRQEQMMDWYRKCNLAFRLGKEEHFYNHDPMNISWTYPMLGEGPMNLNQTMFLMCVKYIMSDEQQKVWLPLCL